jgi:hypothetical protein
MNHAQRLVSRMGPLLLSVLMLVRRCPSQNPHHHRRIRFPRGQRAILPWVQPVQVPTTPPLGLPRVVLLRVLESLSPSREQVPWPCRHQRN